MSGSADGRGGSASPRKPSPRKQSQRKPTPSAPEEIKDFLREKCGITDTIEVDYVKNEKEVFNKIVDVMNRWDADILVGWEIQMLSWGYLLQRASQLNVKLDQLIARTKVLPHSYKQVGGGEDDSNNDLQISGRIVLNLWKVLRGEVTLNNYTFENVMYHCLQRRVPLYSTQQLTMWYTHPTSLFRHRTLEHYMTRTRGALSIISQLDLIGQTSEFARVFGIEFYHVLSRGSQYRVESMMLRITKPLNFIAVSPSVRQRSQMKAPECIQLNMEPDSRFYTDPVVVLDFRSLYPSIMIAYNYCFSTCLGKLEHLDKSCEGPIEFGCTTLEVSPGFLKKHAKDLHICPNGVVFVKSHVRKGVLPRMVEDILKTRFMVKKAKKDHGDDKTLSKVLHARQLGLKLIANVIYGYTSANFSGRMPCVEVGDSIVRKARETLERAIQFVEGNPKWQANVVYGDTDSLFVELKGRSKEEAFRIGQEISEAVTADNPNPVKLIFEKVYWPCVLQTKKRYVGYMYETIDQAEPVYDAKGIETVRRDSCTAVSKILERSLKILFNTQDISQIKSYVQSQCLKLTEGNASVQDCVFAKEYRGIFGYRPGACVPALEIARKRLAKDRRSEPRSGERVAYVIVYGMPGLPLIQLVREPTELNKDVTLRINATYYITKQILPALNRALSLLGVDVYQWYDELPRVHKIGLHMPQQTANTKGVISQYFASNHCLVCNELTVEGICAKCRRSRQVTLTALYTQINKAETRHKQVIQICSNCTNIPDPSHYKCWSMDCPVLYSSIKHTRNLATNDYIRKMIDKFF